VHFWTTFPQYSLRRALEIGLAAATSALGVKVIAVKGLEPSGV